MPRVMAARALLALLLAALGASAAAALAGPSPTLAVGATGAAFALGLAFAFDRWISQPLSEMSAVLGRITGGDRRARIRSRRDDEIGHLGRAIDRAADDLDARLGAAAREDARRGAILDAMVEAVLVTDAEGRIAISNAALAELCGGSPAGKTVMEAVRSPELEEAVRGAADGKKHRAIVTVTGERRTRILEATVSPLPPPGGVVVVFHDVTELRRTDAVRRDFVANASHELRTPLTSIRGFAETLEGGALGEPAVAKRFVRGIVENSNRLQRLVEDLLELSRAESPDASIELSPVPVGTVAARVLRSLEARARDRRIQLALEPGPAEDVALADERSLDQVLVNLVENAIKYTPEGGHVRVRVGGDESQARISVVDDGPGIAEQHLPRLFERFYRVDPGRSRDQGGTGLGLSIVKHLVVRMRGEVDVESRVGKGTTFTVRLGRPPRPAGPERGASGAGASAATPR